MYCESREGTRLRKTTKIHGFYTTERDLERDSLYQNSGEISDVMLWNWGKCLGAKQIQVTTVILWRDNMKGGMYRRRGSALLPIGRCAGYGWTAVERVSLIEVLCYNTVTKTMMEHDWKWGIAGCAPGLNVERWTLARQPWQRCIALRTNKPLYLKH